MRTEDGSIIRECLNGKPWAFGVLVDKYKAGIYAFVYTELRNFHDAEDVTQEVFLQAYRGLRSLRRWESFSFWLYRIALNLCKKWIRTQSRRPDSEFIEDQDPRMLEVPSADFHREDRVNESLREALDSLPRIYREVIMLHYFGGMDTRDIAEATGTSPSTVRKRLSRARAQLREEMIAMMGTAFEGQRLQASFTFRIVEAVKRLRIDPVPRTAGLPWGLSLAAGVIIAILSIGSRLDLPDLMKHPMSSELPGEMVATELREMPVEVLSISRVPVSFGRQSNGYGSGFQLPNQQNATLMAPRGEGGEFPEEPSAQLGKGTIGYITLSPDGTLIATAGSAGIWLHDANSLDEVAVLECETYCITFSPNSKTLASGMLDGTVTLWDTNGKKQIGSMAKHTGTVTAIAYSPDGDLIASGGGDKVVRLWDVREQKLIAVLEGHTGMVGSISFSPDGKLLASGGSSDEDKTVRLWDVEEQRQLAVLEGHTSVITSVTFSPDGSILASGSHEGEAILWSVKEQKQINVLPAEGVYSVDFSPDGQSLVVGGNEVSLWNTQGDKEIQLPEECVFWAYFSPDGKPLITGGTGYTVCIWDIQRNKQIGLIDGYVYNANCVAFSADSRFLASCSVIPTVDLWSIDSQKKIGLFTGHTQALWSVAISPDGELIASGGQDKDIRLWDIPSQKQVGLLSGHIANVRALAFSPDGKLLASASYDRTVRLWDSETHKQVGVLNASVMLSSVAFSPDGEMLASGGGWGNENVIYLWEVKSQKQMGILRGHTGLVNTVAFSPDGKLLASGGQDNSIRFWDVQGQKQVGIIQNLESMINSVAFSPDGKWLASGSTDFTIRIWDVKEYKQMALWNVGFVSSVAFSPDGKWLASGGASILLWEVDITVQDKSVDPMGKATGTWGEVKKIELLQNFPNPLNPETWIPFTLSEPEHVKIRIYTSAGQLVRTLDLGQKPPGAYLSKEKAAYWDGTNENGEIAASDVYFYVMEAGGHIDLKKMVLAR